MSSIRKNYGWFHSRFVRQEQKIVWIAVRERFQSFHRELELTSNQLSDGFGKATRVGQALERAYNGQSTESPPIIPVGSWGKGTQVRPSTDIDVLALFHDNIFSRFEKRLGNKQSELLQEIRDHLLCSYPQTRVRGDGQVVSVAFDTITVEVVPVFALTGSQYLMPDTGAGGRWKVIDPHAQMRIINEGDLHAQGNVRPIAKMIKLWKRENNIPLKSFVIELLVAEFMHSYAWASSGYFWYDWIIRDFFRFLLSRAFSYVIVPGTNDVLNIGGDWKAKVEAAVETAEWACDFERADMVAAAGARWQTIFGPRIQMATQFQNAA